MIKHRKFGRTQVKKTMKNLVVLCDGMADYKFAPLGNQTPMTVAKKPTMNQLAQNGLVGLVKTVGDGFKPGSDVANLSVMGYDPNLYYTGRSPLEAASIGIAMNDTDIALRCNLVTLSQEEEYAQRTMVDYCAGDISTAEADELIQALKKAFVDSDEFTLYTGVSYRHCLIWHNGSQEIGELTPPHDISGQKITDHLPTTPAGKKLLAMMEKSYEVLKDHPVNQKRVERGLRPANSMWLWGDGKAVSLPAFEEKYGMKGAVISAVDLIKGIGKLARMDVIEVEGATGYLDTNFEGKAQAAMEALKEHDFVYVHVEAPDECGHRCEPENKVKALELIDEKILAPCLHFLDENYEDYRILVMPDHATPLALRTHVSDPIPFLMYRKSKAQFHPDMEVYDEDHAAATGVYIDFGPNILKTFLNY